MKCIGYTDYGKQNTANGNVETTMDKEKMKEKLMSISAEISESAFEEIYKCFFGDIETSPSANLQTGLNEKQTFENFHQAEENKEALKLSILFSDNFDNIKEVDISSNVLLLQGGRGKTHLLNAIGNRCFHGYPECKIRYVTASSFADEFVASIQSGCSAEFAKKYMDCDLLLFDHLEDLSGKEATCMEICNIFDNRYQMNKRMVFALSGKVSAFQAPEKLKRRLQFGEIANL